MVIRLGCRRVPGPLTRGHGCRCISKTLDDARLRMYIHDDVTAHHSPRKRTMTKTKQRSRIRRNRRNIRAGGPIDMFDRELIGFVIDRSHELGMGGELYDDVAELNREDRAALWAALSPVVDITYGLDTA